MLAGFEHQNRRVGTFARTALLCVVLGAVALGAPSAQAEMRSKQLGKNLCKTTGGGKFVGIPGFPGERIDRRLLADIAWMRRRYDIFITDGYALSGHAANGEHPIGLAADIVPSRSGSWNKIDRLARKAEPSQNRPRLPWRWVGYDGDAGHGRHHHLHLSWAHSLRTRPGRPARWVLTRKCPKAPDGGGQDGGGISTRSGSDPYAGLAPPVPERSGTAARG